jgi:hypothetical protein
MNSSVMYENLFCITQNYGCGYFKTRHLCNILYMLYQIYNSNIHLMGTIAIIIIGLFYSKT